MRTDRSNELEAWPKFRRTKPSCSVVTGQVAAPHLLEAADDLGKFVALDDGVGSGRGQVVGLAGLVRVADASRANGPGGSDISRLVTDEGALVGCRGQGLGSSLDQMRAWLHEGRIGRIASLAAPGRRCYGSRRRGPARPR